MLPLKDYFTRRARGRPTLSGPRPPFLAWRLFGWAVVGGLAATLMASSWFVYDRVYRTLEDATTIILLSSTEDMETINFTAFEEARQLVARKMVLTPIPKTLHNPFVFAAAATSSLPANPKK